MSDWGATHSTVAAAIAGLGILSKVLYNFLILFFVSIDIILIVLDQEMPSDTFFGAPLAQAVSAGQVPQSRLDDMVTRILTGLYQAGAMQNIDPTGINFLFCSPPFFCPILLQQSANINKVIWEPTWRPQHTMNSPESLHRYSTLKSMISISLLRSSPNFKCRVLLLCCKTLETSSHWCSTGRPLRSSEMQAATTLPSLAVALDT